MSQFERIAAALMQAEETNTPIAPVRDQIATLQDAYAIQHMIRAKRVAAGGRIVGRKVGLTNPAVQAQLGVTSPVSGTLFAERDMPHAGVIPWADGAQWKIEAEVAFILGRDLAMERPTMGEVIRAVDYVVPALEIAGSRIAGWDLALHDMVADSAAAAFFTLGPGAKRLDAVDLLECRMALFRDGEEIAEGSGRACLESPLNALLWLAQAMAADGTPLTAGDVVMSGSLGPMVDAAPGARFTAEIAGLGEAAIRFGPAG